jgi:hypothetical protein
MGGLGRGLRLAFVAGQGIWLSVSLYQSMITLLGRARPAPYHRPVTTGHLPTFGLIVCARDEAPVIANITTGLLSQEYPRELFDVVVVAHNCSDDTASVAARAGATVVEARTERPGKSQAMLAGLEALEGRHYDYIGIFDADSRVPATLLATIADASPGQDCLQAETVPHETGDWLSTGYGLGRRARNIFWWRPREALGLGTTVSGSGYFIRPVILRTFLERQRTLTEDLELTARLYGQGGWVTYVSSTYVQVEEAHTLKTSVRQRLRWARGHLSVLRHEWPPLVVRALCGDRRALDMAVYMVAPTRMLTRMTVSAAFLLSLLRVPGAVPLRAATVVMAGEWGVPAVVAFRERLVPWNLQGLRLAWRHGLLSMLWFPIGLWGLVTMRATNWEAIPRAAPAPTGDDVLPIG